MTTLVLGDPAGFGFGRFGTSDQARKVDHLAAGVIRRIKTRADQSYVFDDLIALQEELIKAGSSAAQEAPFAFAERFLLALPPSLPAPELSLDPDGEIAFDWAGEHGKNFSVSIGVTGKISYAGKLGPYKTVYGSDQFDDVVPGEVIQAVLSIKKGT